MSLPVACDAIAEPVDAIASDAALFKDRVGEILIDGLKRGKSIRLDLQEAVDAISDQKNSQRRMSMEKVQHEQAGSTSTATTTLALAKWTHRLPVPAGVNLRWKRRNHSS